MVPALGSFPFMPIQTDILLIFVLVTTMLTPETNPAHVVPALHPLQPLKQDIACRLLIKSGISPSALLHSQLTLFEEADDDQKSRLIELWRIVPPTYARKGGQGLADGLDESQTTTIRQEEELAWLRYQSDAHREEPSSTDNYLDRTQHCSRITDQPLGSSASGIGNVSQEPWDHQHSQTDYQPAITNDIQDEEML